MVQRAPLLRIAILGETNTTNVWKLFDEPGADYWNYVTQANYWPRLYYLAPPSLDLMPAAAKGEPTSLVCDAVTCTATVNLQPDLTWTDGSSLTAADVAFTVNTALHFRLGLNWHSAYNPDVLDHAEALNDVTVKFYFNGAPSVSDWQYGVLQGPIVNQAYWEPRIVDAEALLPDETLWPTIQQLQQEYNDLQTQIDSLDTSLNSMAPGSDSYNETSRNAQHTQDDQNSVLNKIDKNRTLYESQLADARASLYSLATTNEPTLGSWKFSSRIELNFENQANLGTPFGDPWFDRAHYYTYPNEAAATQALLDNKVDMVLTPDGLSKNSVDLLAKEPEITISRNVTRSARFLAFNQANLYLADPVLRQALACMIDPQTLADSLGEDVAPLPTFVLDAVWQNQTASLPCVGANGDTRLTMAVDLLKGAGYSWLTEPLNGAAGLGLMAPDGKSLPSFTLLAPFASQDASRSKAADVIAQQATLLGLQVSVQNIDHDALLYAVYGSGDYDMALLGWRLSAYPSYLCDWFTTSGQNPFFYNGNKLKSTCETWGQTGNLEDARAYASEVQLILSQDLPLVPLYAVERFDAYRNVSYPFTNVVDGLGGLYGAPALAIPNP